MTRVDNPSRTKGSGRATRADVARRAGVSVATVSYVVNSGPRPVAPHTREGVLRAIRALDYRPSEIARSLRLQRTRMIGLIVPDTANPFFASLARGVDETASTHGYSLLLCHSEYLAERERAYVEALLSKGVEGVIYIQGTPDPTPLRQLLQAHTEVVTVDREVPDVRVDRVIADNFGGSAAATRHLIGLGHRRIACIARRAPLSNATERIRGYQAALADAGVEAEPCFLATGGPGYAEGRRAMTDLMSLRPRPTAVLAYPDVVAIGAVRAACDLGLRVPEDVSIVGFDDIPVSAFLCPALTTVALGMREMGQRAAQLLLERIRGEAPSAPKRVVVPATLVIRESTARPLRNPLPKARRVRRANVR